MKTSVYSHSYAVALTVSVGLHTSWRSWEPPVDSQMNYNNDPNARREPEHGDGNYCCFSTVSAPSTRLQRACGLPWQVLTKGNKQRNEQGLLEEGDDWGGKGSRYERVTDAELVSSKTSFTTGSSNERQRSLPETSSRTMQPPAFHDIGSGRSRGVSIVIEP